MKDMVMSETTGKSYDTNSVVRLVNMQQLAAYMANGVELLDIYSSRDFKTNKPILVGIVDRKASQKCYDLWCKHELN